MVYRTLITLAAVVACSVPAFADVVTLPAYSFYGAGYGPSVTQIGNYTTNNPGGANYGSASYAGAVTPSPSVNAASNSAADINAGEAISNSFAELQYYVEVTGPTSTVQVNFNGAGGVSGSFSQPGNDQDTFIGVDAKLSIQGLFTDETNITVTDSGGSSENGFAPSISDASFNSSGSPLNGYSGLFLDTRTITMTTGIAYLVDLQVKANTLSQGPGMSATAAAYVDPTFTIGSGVPDADQYSFAFSPGVGNGPIASAPEPATLALFGSCLAMLAGIRRSRSVKSPL